MNFLVDFGVVIDRASCTSTTRWPYAEGLDRCVMRVDRVTRVRARGGECGAAGVLRWRDSLWRQNGQWIPYKASLYRRWITTRSWRGNSLRLV